MQSKIDGHYAVLFVDDEEKTRKYFDRAFSREFRIFTASGVAAARELLEQHGDEIGVLISDQRMPEEKGVVLLRHARERYPHIVRILTTAYSDLDDAIESVNTGEILRYITKPWDLKLLGSELRHAMRFFHLQRERDQLMQEKLSVQQRLIEVNRARDLIVMAGSFSQVRNPLQAIRSFLMQLPVGKPAADKIADRWQLLEEQLTWILETAKGVIQHTSSQGVPFESTDLVQLWGDIAASIDGPVSVEASFAESLPPVKVQVPLVRDLFNLLIRELQSLVKGGEGGNVKLSAIASGDGAGSEEGVRVQFQNGGGSLEDAEPLFSSVGLLSAFFIAHHHGGSLDVWGQEGVSFELFLPLDATEADQPAPDIFWLDDLFARYEQGNG